MDIMNKTVWNSYIGVNVWLVCQFVVLLLALANSAFLLHKEMKYFWHYV